MHVYYHYSIQLQTPQSFYNSIHELVATLKKSGDVMNLSSLKPSLELIASINTNPGMSPADINCKCILVQIQRIL